MREKILWCAVGLLSAACAAQAYHIRSERNARREPAVEDFWREQDEWLSRARKGMLGGAPLPSRSFDELFSDEFFGRRFDPFAEIESFKKRMAPLLPQAERSLLGRSWEGWFKDRMGVAELETEVKATDTEVILSFRAPGLEKGALDIDVNKDRIRIAYDVKEFEERNDEKSGARLRSESARRIEKILPIPPEADPDRSRVAREGDTVKIVFERRGRRA